MIFLKGFWIWIHLPYLVLIGVAFLAKGLWGENRGLLIVVEVIIVLAIFVYGYFYSRMLLKHMNDNK